MACIDREKIISFDEAWAILQEQAINKLIANLDIEGLPANQYFTMEESMRFYTIVYNVCQNSNFNATRTIVERCKRTFEDYISSKVLASLRGKENENLLLEFLKRWNNHSIMSAWISKFFQHVSKDFHENTVGRHHSLKEISQTAFAVVCGEIKDQVCDAIISLVDREREGEEIDRAMVKQVLDIYKVSRYAEDIERALVDSSARFYSKKALQWTYAFSYEDYMHKIVDCMEREKIRVTEYSLTNKDKILEVVQHQLLNNVHASKLEEMGLLHAMQLLQLRNETKMDCN